MGEAWELLFRLPSGDHVPFLCLVLDIAADLKFGKDRTMTWVRLLDLESGVTRTTTGTRWTSQDARWLVVGRLA